MKLDAGAEGEGMMDIVQSVPLGWITTTNKEQINMTSFLQQEEAGGNMHNSSIHIS